jgi:hypothetical protein
MLSLALVGLAQFGCKQPAPAAPEPPPVRVAIEPAGAVMTAGHQLKFLCTVTDGPAEVAVWSVLEPGGGSVDNLGRYRAALVPGTYTLQAGLVSGRATTSVKIQVVPPPNGNIAAPARVARGATGLKASVPAVPGSSYAWTVQGGQLVGDGSGNAITFEAGREPLVRLTCRVTNLAKDILNSTLEIPIAERQTLTISPGTATLTVGSTMKFGFELLGGAGSEVQWRVDGAGAGQVDGRGSYQAPACPGRFQVRVISKDEPDTEAVAVVKVVAAPVGAIAAPDKVKAGAAGLVAAITPQEGMTYAWEIAGGSMVDGAHGPSLTFQAGSGPKLTLRCTIQNEAGDSLRVSRELVVE